MPKFALLFLLVSTMLGLRAWGDDLVVVLFEFLEDDTKLAQSCTDWLSNVSLNQRGCGSPVKAQAQASAQVDVPTAPHVCKFLLRMLGYVLHRQPTVILRVST